MNQARPELLLLLLTTRRTSLSSLYSLDQNLARG